MNDIIIIGAGPAGMTSAIYAKRAGYNPLVFEKNTYGGQIINSSEVANYPGIKKIDGYTFATKIYEQLKELEIEIKHEEVINIKKNDKTINVITNKNEYECKSVIIATGLTKRKLNIENEEKLIGKGISYCATCDGAFFKENDVAVVGGGNTALEDAIFLSNYCKHVYLINRTENFKAEKSLLDSFKQKNNTEIITSANIKKLVGKEKLEKIVLHYSNSSGNRKKMAQDREKKLNKLRENKLSKENGFIKSNEECTTNIPGIFVAGDIRNKSVRQIVTSVSDGAVAAINAVKYIEKI